MQFHLSCCVANAAFHASHTRMLLVVVSPHRDDAAFSCSLALLHWSRCAISMALLNCFTQSSYAPNIEGDEEPALQRVEMVSRVRQCEDRQFISASAAHLECVDLNLLDAPLRLGATIAEVCTLQLSKDAYAREVDTIARHMRTVVMPDLVVLPLALGEHIDHRIARDAGIQAFASIPIAFYEDLPYAARVENAVFERRLQTFSARLGSALQPIVIQRHDAAERKRHFASIYSSQIAPETADEIASFSLRYGGGERLWLQKSWPAMLRDATLSGPYGPSLTQ